MKKSLAAIALAALTAAGGCLTAQPALADGAKVGVVNLDRIMRESLPAQAAQKRLESKFSSRQKNLENNIAKFKDDVAAFQRAEGSLSESERSRRRRALAERERDLQRRERELREDFNIQRNEEFQRMLERGNQIIRDLAVREGYDLIVQEGVYFSPRIDITDKVISAFNSKK